MIGARSRLAVIGSALAVALVVAPAADAGPAPNWSKWFRVAMHGVEIGTHRTLVVVGNSSEDYPGKHFVLRQLRRDGSVVAVSSWGPSDGGARARGLAVFGRAVYVTGVVSPDVAGGACEETGSFGWFVRRSNPAGTQAWVRTLRGWRRCSEISAGPTAAGPDLAVIGTTQHIEGYTDVHGRILAFDAQGEVRWQNAFEPFKVGGAEGHDADDVNALAVDRLGRAYAAGWAWRYPRETGADHEAVLIALGQDGGRRWVRVLGESGQPRDDEDRGTDVDARRSRVLFGAIIDKGDRSVARVVMYDLSGRVRWMAAFPAAISSRATAKVAIGANGVAYLAMTRPRTDDGKDLIIRKLGQGGKTLWRVGMPSHRPVDLAVGIGGLHVLTPHHLWRFPA